MAHRDEETTLLRHMGMSSMAHLSDNDMTECSKGIPSRYHEENHYR